MIFKDRADAGKKLAVIMKKFAGQTDTIVLGLPRGGVITAQVVANELKLPLDLLIVRKIGSPSNEEFAIGALSQDGQIFLDEDTIKLYNISPEHIEKTTKSEQLEADRRQQLYRQGRAPLNLKHKTAILVDDGIATGATMQAAILSVKAHGASRIIVAIPVIASDSLKTLQGLADEVFYLDAPFFFGAVGSFYSDFSQTTDEEVIKIMAKA